MAYKITDKCVACGTCQTACTMDAIQEEGGRYRIDPNACVECGACEGECPENAIELDA